MLFSTAVIADYFDADNKMVGFLMEKELNASWKNFDILANFYGTIGNDIYNLNKDRYFGTNGQNVIAGTYDKAWRPDNTNTDVPRLSVNDANGNHNKPSTFFVEDGSYMRLKLLQIGYTLPKKVFNDKLTMRLSLSAQNLFTISGYSGMDPETASMGGACHNVEVVLLVELLHVGQCVCPVPVNPVIHFALCLVLLHLLKVVDEEVWRKGV